MRVSVDPRKIQQVLNNLVSNAIRFSHGGSSVWIALKAGADMARITVRDEGEGIAAEDVPSLFQPFTRASRSAQPVSQVPGSVWR